MAAMFHDVAAHEPTDDRDRFFQPVEADRCRIEVDAHGLVLRGHPSGPEAVLEAPIGQQIDSGQFFRQHDGVAKIVAVHDGAHPQRCGRGRSGCQRRSDRHVIDEVVRHCQDVVAKALGLTSQLGPVSS